MFQTKRLNFSSLVPLQINDTIKCQAPSNNKRINFDDHHQLSIMINESEQSHQLESSSNHMINNCWSILERELPTEIMISILQFLNLQDLGILNRVSRNFRYHWILHPEVNWKHLNELKNHNYLFIGPSTESELSTYLFYHYWYRKFEQSFYKLEYGRENFNSDFACVYLIGPPRSGKLVIVDHL